MKRTKIFPTAAVLALIVVLFIVTAPQARELPQAQQTKAPAALKNVQSTLATPSELSCTISMLFQSLTLSWGKNPLGSIPIHFGEGGITTKLLPYDGGDNGCIKRKRPDTRKEEVSRTKFPWWHVPG